ncbi:MAG: choice-of-anchor L domain-containing protein [Tropicimonas sp.]|uniref:choice-of-anchor L domain-containing protein n=1 Tax=Tropicimonas sp. TaxID=2067044 RepID=UPI003A851599
MKTTVFCSAVLAIAASGASALTTTNTTDAAALAAASLAASSGITIVSGSESLIGSDIQQGIYNDFNLTSADTSQGDDLSIKDGIFLTSGGGDFTTTNTDSNFNKSSGTGSHQALVDLAGTHGLSTTQNDSNVLRFDFTLDDPTQNAVRAQFIFATDEFNTESVTDILGIFVNGVNYAFFPNGDLVSNQSGDPNDFFNNNEFGQGTYGIEWDGLTGVFDITLLANGGGAVNSFELAIADTEDTIFDSAVFFTGLNATTNSGGGGITDPVVPLPAAGWMLLSALGGIALRARRKRA